MVGMDLGRDPSIPLERTRVNELLRVVRSELPRVTVESSPTSPVCKLLIGLNSYEMSTC